MKKYIVFRTESMTYSKEIEAKSEEHAIKQLEDTYDYDNLWEWHEYEITDEWAVDSDLVYGYHRERKTKGQTDE